MQHSRSALEAELLAFLRPDETAAELLARTYVEPFYTGLPLVDQHVSFRPGNVLEVAGAAGSGKTELLLQVRGGRRVGAEAPGGPSDRRVTKLLGKPLAGP